MVQAPASEDSFERLWREFLDSDINRFKAMHQRARADAGPSFIGGARGIDHWTFEWARRALIFSLREASTVILGYAERMDREPADLVRLARPGLQAQHAEYFAILEADLSGPPANEFAVRPSREALAEVKSFIGQRTERALSAVARGQMDADLVVKSTWYAGIADAVGGGQRLLLYAAIAAFLLAMWATL